jgi:hypothetical protein
MTFRESSTTIEFAALFLAVTIVMLAAWWGTRALALARRWVRAGLRRKLNLPK